MLNPRLISVKFVGERKHVDLFADYVKRKIGHLYRVPKTDLCVMRGFLTEDDRETLYKALFGYVGEDVDFEIYDEDNKSWYNNFRVEKLKDEIWRSIHVKSIMRNGRL